MRDTDFLGNIIIPTADSHAYNLHTSAEVCVLKQ